MTSETLSNLKQKRALSISETAEFVGVSRGTVNNWLSFGLLPFEELPGRGHGGKRFRKIRTLDLLNFLDTYHQSNKKSESNQSRYPSAPKMELLPRK